MQSPAFVLLLVAAATLVPSHLPAAEPAVLLTSGETLNLGGVFTITLDLYGNLVVKQGSVAHQWSHHPTAYPSCRVIRLDDGNISVQGLAAGGGAPVPIWRTSFRNPGPGSTFTITGKASAWNLNLRNSHTGKDEWLGSGNGPSDAGSPEEELPSDFGKVGSMDLDLGGGHPRTGPSGPGKPQGPSGPGRPRGDGGPPPPPPPGDPFGKAW